MKASTIACGLALSLALAAGWRMGATAIAQPGAAMPTSRVAVVDMLSLVEKLVDSDRYKPARDLYQKDQSDKMQKINAELQELQTKIMAMKEEDPERAKQIEVFQSKRQDQQNLGGGVEEFNAKQVAEAYRLAMETATALADKRGYTHVIASRTDETLIRSTNVAGAVQEMLARTVVKAPKGDDLTAELVKELKLDAVKEEKKDEKKDSPPKK